MKTTIIGAGGVGGFFGGKMIKNGKDVTLVARGAHYEALKSQGLTVKCVEGDFHLPDVPVIATIGAMSDSDLVLIFVKTFHTPEVARQLRQVIQADTLVITFQTGLDNDLQFQDALAHPFVFPGLAYINSSRTAPGVIEQISGPCTLTFGARDAQDNRRLHEVLQLFRRAQINANLAADIEQEIWTKLIWISAFAGLTAIHRSPIGPILNDVQGKHLFHRCLAEAEAIARAQGVHLPKGLDRRLMRKIAFYKTRGQKTRTSLLLDMENGRLTEVETIHGALVRRARTAQVETPTLDLIYSVIKLHNLTAGRNG